MIGAICYNFLIRNWKIIYKLKLNRCHTIKGGSSRRVSFFYWGSAVALHNLLQKCQREPLKFFLFVPKGFKIPIFSVVTSLHSFLIYFLFGFWMTCFGSQNVYLHVKQMYVFINDILMSNLGFWNKLLQWHACKHDPCKMNQKLSKDLILWD